VLRTAAVPLFASVLIGPALGQLPDSNAAVPRLTGLTVYQAHRALRRLGLRAVFSQVSGDTSTAAEFYVVGQEPDSGTTLHKGDSVRVLFNTPRMLRYWNLSVIPLLGDFDNTVGFYKVQQPPKPVKVTQAEYPIELVRYTFFGDVEVEALVDFDGSVLAARVTKSSGYDAADSAACEAALKGSFTPAQHYDAPVRVWFPLPFHFEYKEPKGLPTPENKAPADIGP
jgi:TonB family protein